jgi:hypothetical protein
MRTFLVFPLYVIAAAVTLMLSSCGKHDITPDCGAPFCQIETLDGFDSNTQGHSISTIEYNAAGNPILRSRSDLGTGNENESYRYDAHNRLTDRITHYKEHGYGDFFWEWHRFKYDHLGRIYLDSVYNIGLIGDHPLPHPVGPRIIFLLYFEYDYKGRVVKEKAFFEDGRPWYVRDYIYDRRQNLEKKILTYEGSSDTVRYSTYDNKINYLRTNKVWQFLTRDYSENNSIPAVSYNKYGLPLVFSPGNKAGRRTYFLDVEYTDLKITYKCK